MEELAASTFSAAAASRLGRGSRWPCATSAPRPGPPGRRAAGDRRRSRLVGRSADHPVQRCGKMGRSSRRRVLYDAASSSGLRFRSCPTLPTDQHENGELLSGLPVTDFNWHPAIHTKAYREELYFFLVRYREPHYTPVASQLRRLLAAAGVTHACEYTIFGYWDGLVRVWLSPSSRNRLVSLLDSHEYNIEEHRFLVATNVHYLWHSDADLLKDNREVLGRITKFERQIGEIVASDVCPAPAADKLRDAGLILRRPASAPGNVKFYIVLEKAGEPMTRSKQMPLVLKGLEGAGMTARSSLYAGDGDLAVYLVRCVADSYADVLEWTARLDPHLKDTRLRSMTLLVANADALESDHVNDPAVISQAAEQVLQLLGVEGDEHHERGFLAALSEEDQAAFCRIVRGAYEKAVPGTELQEQFTAILCASLRNDHQAFKGSLPFLVDLEYYFGAYLQGAWSDVFGENWLSAVVEQLATGDKNAKAAAAAMSRPQEEWGLGPYIQGALETAGINVIFASRLSRQLGGDWRRRVRSLHGLRNDFSHGRLARLQWLRDYSGKGGKLLVDLVDACAFSSLCERLADDEFGLNP